MSSNVHKSNAKRGNIRPKGCIRKWEQNLVWLTFVSGMTLTLKRAIQNMASACRLNVVNICVRFLRNLSRGSRVTERKGKKVIWPLTPKYDLDLESSRNIAFSSSQSG